MYSIDEYENIFSIKDEIKDIELEFFHNPKLIYFYICLRIKNNKESISLTIEDLEWLIDFLTRKCSELKQ